MGNPLSEIVLRNEAGELEVINVHTGEVIHSNRSPGLPPASYRFDYATALRICQLVKEGKTMKEVCEEPDMPPQYVISHWQRTDRMFAEELKIARKERGEVYHDRAMEIAVKASEGKYHKDDVPAMTLAVKTFQWGAERAKPESYGNKVTHEGSTEKPILMRVINTGISRETKPDVVVVESKEVTDVSKERTAENEDD